MVVGGFRSFHVLVTTKHINLMVDNTTTVAPVIPLQTVG